MRGRDEAEAIYEAGLEAVVEVLLAMDRPIRQLEARVEKLERELAKNSRNSSLLPSSDPPGKRSPARGKSSGLPQGAEPRLPLSSPLQCDGCGAMWPSCAADEP